MKSMSLLFGHEAQLYSVAPAGFYIGLRVGFSFPSEELNRLPEAWVQHYTLHGLVVHDPVMKWVYSTEGVSRWSDINLEDSGNVFGQAADFGLNHGAVVSVLSSGGSGRRSYGNFSRSDRAFSDVELEMLQSMVKHLHQASGQQLSLTDAEIEALGLQSQGLRLKQIAAELNISVSAVKARLSNAKRKLGAQTPSQAASIAKSRGIL